jgi:uncharacterized protein YggE
MEDINKTIKDNIKENVRNQTGFWIKAVNWSILLIIFISIWNFLGGRAIVSSDQQVNTITVSGRGEIMVKPDIATISFGVSAENMDVAKAQTESAEKMNKIIDFLRENKIEEKDIKTTNYNIYPRYDYPRTAVYPYGNRQVLVGYVVSQTVEVKIRDLTKTGDVLSGVGTFGVTDVSGLNFSLDKIEDKQKEARNLAIEDARKEAKVLAKSLGVRLIEITNFSESGRAPMYYGFEKAALGMGGDNAMVSPQIPVGENTITSNVSITYKIR